MIKINSLNPKYKILILLLLIISFSGVVSTFAQENETKKNKPIEDVFPELFDNSRLRSIQLQNLIERLRENPQKVLHFVIYNRKGSNKRKVFQILKESRDYLIKKGMIESNRIFTFYGGEYNYLGIDFYIVDKKSNYDDLIKENWQKINFKKKNKTKLRKLRENIQN
ncbi:MAG: hypothetical protein K1X72_04155 [Pyrinomonadaceae bacterium]|nr:hypothetical protein [Pyrinomonadaceae bacterium]